MVVFGLWFMTGGCHFEVKFVSNISICLGHYRSVLSILPSIFLISVNNSSTFVNEVQSFIFCFKKLYYIHWVIFLKFVSINFRYSGKCGLFKTFLHSLILIASSGERYTKD